MQQDQHSHHGYIGKQGRLSPRLRRIEGQARGLQSMVEEEKYCIDILTQVSAMTSALQWSPSGLLDEHKHCLVFKQAVRRDRASVLFVANTAPHPGDPP